MLSSTLKLRMAPAKLLRVGLGYLLILVILSCLAAGSAPWLGLTLGPADNNGVPIQDVVKPGPLAEHDLAGQTLVAIHTDEWRIATRLPLLYAEPDDVSLYSTYRDIFALNAGLQQLLAQGPVTLELANGQSITAKAWAKRPLDTLPPLFWYQIFCASAIFCMGIGVVAFIQDDQGAQLYATAALGLSLSIAASASYTTRELVMAAALFPWLSQLNQLGAMTFATCGAAMLWHFPQRLHHFPFTALCFLIMAGFLTVNYLHLHPSLDVTVRLSLFFWLCVDIVLATLQWRRTRHDPIGRARLKWFIYSWFSGVVSYLGLVVAPQLLGGESIVPQSYGWGFFVLTYGGIALGIVQFRLFDLDRWIISAWFWFLCGVLILVVDVALIALLHANPYMTISLTLALVGWIYFPLRQFFFQLVIPRNQRQDNLVDFRRLMISDAFKASSSLERQWREVLEQLFKPLTIKTAQHPSPRPMLGEHGLRLYTPPLGNSPALELAYANGGRRLFNRHDLQLLEECTVLFDHAREYRQNFMQTVLQERARVAHDLHDDVGGRLLNIIYRSNDESLRTLAREALNGVRQVIQDLEEPSQSLGQFFSQWENENRQRLAACDITLESHFLAEDPELQLSPRQGKCLTLALREAVSNTLKHAAASHCRLRLEADSHYLTLTYEDNGKGISPNHDKLSGHGIDNIDHRLTQCNGQAAWYCPDNGGTGIAMTIPLNSMEASV